MTSNGIGGEFRVKLRTIFTLYHWDGQTLCPRLDGDADFLRDKTNLTSEVPSFCSNISTMQSS
jgi:hypothetical protein